jgi:16S rRNA (cytidine1402-2'-O)-methyltransferase
VPPEAPCVLSLPPATAALLRHAASAAAGEQQYPAPALYVVATPIGNLADLTLRAIHLLGLVDAVACEDTRVAAGLLRHLGLDKPLLALHAHNERTGGAQAVLRRLAARERVAYVSDAGTPAVSDPGAALVADVRAAGHRVVALPGASSVAAALSVAGDAGAQGFEFAGFLPSKGGERDAALRALGARGAARSIVVFEAPHRIEALAAALAATLPGRRLTVCRELTKQFETVHTLASDELPAWLAADAQRRRGEFVLVLHAALAADAGTGDAAQAQRVLDLLLAEALPLRQAVAHAAAITGAKRNTLYAAALAARRGADDDADQPRP